MPFFFLTGKIKHIIFTDFWLKDCFFSLFCSHTDVSKILPLIASFVLEMVAGRMMNLFKAQPCSLLLQVSDNLSDALGPSCLQLSSSSSLRFSLLSFSLPSFLCFVNGGSFPALPFSLGVCCRDQLVHSQNEAVDSSILYFLLDTNTPLPSFCCFL